MTADQNRSDRTVRIRVNWRAVAAQVGTGLAAAAIACVFLQNVADAQAARIAPPDPVPACVTEDSAGPCYWDAATMGNGHGRSFVVGSDQAVYYLPEGR